MRGFLRPSAIVVGCLTVFLAYSCGGGGGGSASTPALSSASKNVLSVTVGGTTVCTSSVDVPCTSVKICQPGTSNCQTISDVVVDTGSFGLRIFKQALSVSLTQETASNGNPLAECAFFGIGTDWGPVMRADVILGGEPAVSVPVQVIEATFAGQTSTSNPCGQTVDTEPQQAGMNGILGIGLFQYDCDAFCATQANNGIYFSCNGSTCSSATAALSSQIQNPVALLPIDNNGVMLDLPSVGAGGAATITGKLFLGIGTETNNTPSGVAVYMADGNGNFTAVWNGQSYTSSFIDSGTNFLGFPNTTTTPIPTCAAGTPDTWYCPSSTLSETATNNGSNGTTGTVSFQVADTATLFASNNIVFDDLAAPDPQEFDWGLPFFLGRKVYVGIEGQSSSLGSGPYWAY